MGLCQMSHKLENGQHTGRCIDRLLTGADGNQRLISFRLKMKITSSIYGIRSYAKLGFFGGCHGTS